ncbi:hypothetical protein TanjilG_18645 [Lupinus angustifolius]|uniref:Transmembrane protein n=2 Tax=Lupinus angustifolius TaxID=3871 RepID=A0A1J7GX49_LUPAN|nr:hypothetical protein TanjilG_18643 [Lupinus angustifolius]OIW05046.1 hypothetical protein TanjilG_18645 [Lupinus angustifolius]
MAATTTTTTLSSILYTKHASPQHTTYHRNISTRLFCFHGYYGHKKRTTTSTRTKPLVVVAVTQGSAESSKSSDEKIPSWAKPDSNEPPPWAKDETNKNSENNNNIGGFQIPFYVYLLASAITAIAAIGSIFEYVNQKPVFGVLSSDSVFYAPLLGFFAFTGIPSSAFLWFKSVQTANKEAEEQDKRDGYK